jgi:hypothetical protein
MKKGLLLTLAACIVLLPACCWRDWCFWRKNRCHRDDCERTEYVETRHERVAGCADGSCRRVRRERSEVVQDDNAKATRLERNGRVVYH